MDKKNRAVRHMIRAVMFEKFEGDKMTIKVMYSKGHDLDIGESSVKAVQGVGLAIQLNMVIAARQNLDLIRWIEGRGMVHFDRPRMTH